MSEKNISEMTIEELLEELLEESHRQYDISSNAKRMAEYCKQAIHSEKI